MSNIEAALTFAAQGIAVFPCNADKEPLTPHGFYDATTDLAAIRSWWIKWPNALIGAPTGDRNGFSVCDLDMKHGKNGFAAVPDWETRSNVLQRTQSGGAHLFFAATGSPANTASAIAPGVDTRGEGGYVVLYDHALKLDGYYPPWPDDLRPPEIKTNGHSNGHSHPEQGTPYGLRALHDETVKVLMAAPGSRNNVFNTAVFSCSQLVDQGYLNLEYAMGMLREAALKAGLTSREIAATGRSAVKGATAHPRNPIEDDPRFNQTEEEQTHGGVVADNWYPARVQRRSQGPLAAIPQHLLNVPGILSEAVTYYEATAAKTQPQFAVQAALALGSVVMGRRFCTDQENYSSLYFLNVSQSATGKEHTKTVLERLLEAAELTRLIGPPGYTSASGVFSSLLQQPTHLCIIDELGRMLQSNRAIGNAHRIDAVTTLMEAFGRLHTTLRQQGYSKVGMTEKQIEAFDKVVLHPALTLITMTTPGSLYENLSSGDIINGFLARFVIVESFLPRQVSNYTSAVPVPNRLVDWMRTVAQGAGNLTSVDTHAIAPSPGVIPFDPECRGMLRDWEGHLLREMNALDPARMETMLGRTKEIAQRLALIVAGSCSALSISRDHLQWAIDYAFFYGQRAITRLRANVADAPFEAACKAVYDAISKGGVRGATHAELVEKTRKYAGLEPRRQREVIESLVLSHGVAMRESATGGRPRRAWVAKIEAVDD